MNKELQLQVKEAHAAIAELEDQVSLHRDNGSTSSSATATATAAAVAGTAAAPASAKEAAAMLAMVAKTGADDAGNANGGESKNVRRARLCSLAPPHTHTDTARNPMRAAIESGRSAVALVTSDDGNAVGNSEWVDVGVPVPYEWMRTEDTQPRLTSLQRDRVEGHVVVVNPDKAYDDDGRPRTLARLRILGDRVTAGTAIHLKQQQQHSLCHAQQLMHSNTVQNKHRARTKLAGCVL